MTDTILSTSAAPTLCHQLITQGLIAFRHEPGVNAAEPLGLEFRTELPLETLLALGKELDSKAAASEVGMKFALGREHSVRLSSDRSQLRGERAFRRSDVWGSVESGRIRFRNTRGHPPSGNAVVFRDCLAVLTVAIHINFSLLPSATTGSMNAIHSLASALWGDCSATLVVGVDDESGSLQHGSAALHLFDKKQLPYRFLGSDARLSVSTTGVALLGYPADFSTTGPDPLSAAGYPGRFELIKLSETSRCLQDREAPDVTAVRELEGEHLGLLFRGNERTVPERQALLLTGTSPLGVHAAALWATQDLSGLEAPPNFPTSPIEAVVRVACPEDSPLAISEIQIRYVDLLHLVCGDFEYDFASSSWQKRVRRTKINVYKNIKGEIIKIIIENKSYTGDSLKQNLLLVLIESSINEKWITIKEAILQIRGINGINGIKLKSEERVAQARIYEIKKMSENPDFILSETTNSGKKYKLNAEIIIKICE